MSPAVSRTRSASGPWSVVVLCSVLSGVSPLAETRWEDRESRGVRSELEGGNRPRSSEGGAAREGSCKSQKAGLGVVGWLSGGVYGE
jgi:hypothetical protein